MIGRQAALGGILMVAARLITRVFDLVTMLILARLLLPADFGLVAIAMTMVSIVEAALELPVNQALLRLPAITAEQYDAAFTLSGLRSLLLTFLLVAAAWPFAQFYGDTRLFALVCVLSLGPAGRGMLSPKMAIFQKNMSFSRDFIVELAGKLVGFGIGVAIALLTGSYWSIAAGTVAYPLTMAVVSYWFAPYRPRLSLAESRVFLAFVGWMSAAQIASAINWQFERLLLGKLQTTARLGLFTTAGDVANIPMAALFGPVLRPMLAAFAHLRDDHAQLARSYQAAASAIMLLGFPLLVGECLVAEPLVLLLLGERWRGAIELLRWLALSTILALFSLPVGPLIMMFGRTDLVFRRNVIEMGVKLPLVVAGTIGFGFAGVIFARCVSEAVCALYGAYMVRRFIAVPILDQLLVVWRPLAGSLAMALPVLACLHAIPTSQTPLALSAGLAAAVAAGAVTYAGTVAALWRASGRPAGLEARLAGALAQRLASRSRVAPNVMPENP